MEEIKFSIGDIVRCGSELLCISEIEGDKVKSSWQSYLLDEIKPVEIGRYDSDITLKSHIPIMASIVGIDDAIPVHQDYYFMEYSIDGVKIKDVVKENNIKYIHELQQWLKDNMPSEYLYFFGM